MNNDKSIIYSIIIGCLIIAIALIICASIVRNSNLLNSHIPPPPSSSTIVPTDFNISQNDILNVYSTALCLGLDQNTLVKMIESNKLKNIPYMKIGDNYAFSRKLLESWVQDSVNKNAKY